MNQRIAQEIEDITEALWEQWVAFDDLSIEAANDMKRELVDHLMDAVADGKAIDDVTGADLRDLADAWAADKRHLTTRPRRLGLMIPALIGGLSAFLFMQLIFQRSWTVEVSTVQLTVLAGVFAAVPLTLRSRLLHQSRPLSTGRWALMVGVVWALAILGAIAIPDRFGDGSKVALPWWVVGPAAITTVLIMVGVPLQSRLGRTNEIENHQPGVG